MHAEEPHASEAQSGKSEAAGRRVGGAAAQEQDGAHRERVHASSAQQEKDDQQWAAICAWLAKHELILHIPMRGSFWFECKRTGAEVERGFKLGT